MQPQKLCLKWNSHTSNLLSVLGDFQQKDILVDVTISCEGHNIKAHKMILSACSPYFQGIFMENPCQHPVVIMNGMKYEDITAILNFMYKGEVNISQEGLTSFLQAAETLKVKGLAEVYENEKKNANSSGQDVQQNEQTPQRTDTPSSRRRHRNRKRSLSDSNRSDDEGSSRKQLREPSSPEVHELSGDESFTGDTNSNGPPFNSVPRVPQNVYSRAHQSSSNLADEDDEFEVEPSKLLEQTLTTENVSMSNSSTDKQLRIERIMGNATEIESSSLQEPESPPDIKPIIDYGDSNAGPSDGTMMLYNDQSQPGPSNLQDGSLLHDNSHAQGNGTEVENERPIIHKISKKVISMKRTRDKINKDSDSVEGENGLSMIVEENSNKRETRNLKCRTKIPSDNEWIPSESEMDSDGDSSISGDDTITLKEMKEKLTKRNDKSSDDDTVMLKEIKEKSTKKNCKCSAFKKCILREIGVLRSNQQKMLDILNVKYEELSEMVINSPSVAGINPEMKPDFSYKEIIRNLPLTSMESLELFEDKLSNESFAQKLIEYMGTIGGESAYSGVMRIMRKFFTNDLAMKFSLVGLKGKHPFKSLRLCNILHETVRRQPEWKDAKIIDTDKAISNWLRHAKARSNNNSNVKKQ